MDICIIRTLSYFDIFDYPLTFSEIKKYLCCKIDCSDDELYDLMSSIPVIQEQNGYFYLLGRQEITSKRNDRADVGLLKLARAKIISKILSFIPTIEYIGLSGSLSMNNASHSDDIDFFFITKKNSLWLTRLLVNILLFVSRQKRDVLSKKVQDKICPNMFVESGKLTFTGKKRTVYTAHELVQLKTLFDRNRMHDRLLFKNKWVSELLPNIEISKVSPRRVSFFERSFLRFLLPFEKVSFIAQRMYMKKRQSQEIVEKNRAFFHPVDRQKLILDMYELRNKRYINMYEDNLWIEKDEARFYLDEKKIRILN